MKFTLTFYIVAQSLLLCVSGRAVAAPAPRSEAPANNRAPAIIVSGDPGKLIPISISGFTGEVDKALRFDLEIAGCSIVSAATAQYLISGSNNGNVQGRLNDPHSKSTLLSKAYSGASVRRQAHAFADDIIQAIAGRKGVAQTKIAFKVDTGANSEIYIADYDGHNAQPVTKDSNIVAAPCWVPGRLALYYTSYKLGNPDIFQHDLGTGQRRPVARYSGLNTSAAVSPDGRRVAMILSKGGSPDVYICDADGSNLKRLTTTKEDESSPCWSPDSQWICFATKLRERRSLCKVPASGGEIQRINTVGVLNPTEPDWSPDGKQIVFTAMMGGFEICVVPSQGGNATQLVPGEDPSWAPNSRTVIFARRQGGRRGLSLLDVPTKQTKDVSRITGSNSQPSWAK
jgi:TolB protein